MAGHETPQPRIEQPANPERRAFLRRAGEVAVATTVAAATHNLWLPHTALGAQRESSLVNPQGEPINPLDRSQAIRDLSAVEEASREANGRTLPNRTLRTPKPERRIAAEASNPLKPGMIFNQGDPSQRVIYLTMDDGYDQDRPDGSTVQGELMFKAALDVAKNNGVKMTFLPTGDVLANNPDMRPIVRRAKAEGHGFGLHTYSHTSLPALTTAEIEREAVRNHRELQKALGAQYNAKFLRPPFGDGGYEGDFDPELVLALKELGLAGAMWTGDTQGYNYFPNEDQATVDQMVENVTPLFNGEIILMHGLPNDIKTMKRIVSLGKSQGFQFKSLNSLPASPQLGL
ncbi:MAG: polysaccharide deacetylase family protein [Candidatus Levybacteria bacterium]|nr:polysaccharide deacetylase family protein [Candidatus Levybacteria bacterium]